MIPKDPGKKTEDAKSYNPIGLLSIVPKIFKKIFIRKLKPIIEEKNLVFNHQFGFGNSHGTSP